MTINKMNTALEEPSERLSSDDSSSDESSSDESSSDDSSGPDFRGGRSEKPSEKKNENSPIPKTDDLSDCRELGGG
jgi:hypothetical protein